MPADRREIKIYISSHPKAEGGRGSGQGRPTDKIYGLELCADVCVDKSRPHSACLPVASYFSVRAPCPAPPDSLALQRCAEPRARDLIGTFLAGFFQFGGRVAAGCLNRRAGCVGGLAVWRRGGAGRGQARAPPMCSHSSVFASTSPLQNDQRLVAKCTTLFPSPACEFNSLANAASRERRGLIAATARRTAETRARVLAAREVFFFLPLLLFSSLRPFAF